MIKSQIRLLIVFLLSSFLISLNAQAFHKTYKETTSKYWDKDKIEKKDFLEDTKKKYCAAETKTSQDFYETIVDEKTGETKLDEDGKIIKKYYIKISGYHSTKSEKAGRLIPNLKAFNFNVKEDTKLVEVLKMYCVQKGSEPRPSKFKGSYLEAFYKDIAFENGFKNEKGDEGNYKLEITEGEKGKDILKSGIVISDPDAIYYIPDYLIAKAEKNKKEASERKSNDDWINKNKQSLITKIEAKLTEYDKKIEKLEKDRSNIKTLLSTYRADLEKAQERVDEVFDDVDISQSQIKLKKKEIRADTKKYLKKDDLERFTTSYKQLKKVNFKNYESYKILSKLLAKAKKSKKKKDFLTKKKKKKLGFIDQFEDLKDKELGSKRDEDSIERLTKDITKEINNLQTYIYGPIQNLEDLDTELSNKFPIVQYAIYLVIFLIVVSVIVYIYFQSRRISSLKKETETAGKKFSDIEGKLKDTSERIKTVGRQSRGRSGVDTTPEPVKEKPRTPEQIIADKFHDMVSDYNEAIDNFAQVASFKQKWNGVALSRKERQDGTKTILINSSRAFEKSEIWCVNFNDKYFAFPGSTVKSNMATYMNLDFEKASRDFKGVFDISTGSSWGTEPSIVRKGGAGFIVERKGKLIFPS